MESPQSPGSLRKLSEVWVGSISAVNGSEMQKQLHWLQLIMSMVLPAGKQMYSTPTGFKHHLLAVLYLQMLTVVMVKGLMSVFA
ncbi:hypothetical protein STEG23_016374 [Scotinomys teguina]